MVETLIKKQEILVWFFSSTQNQKNLEELKDTVLLILKYTKQPCAFHKKTTSPQSLNESNPPCLKLSGS